MNSAVDDAGRADDQLWLLALAGQATDAAALGDARATIAEASLLRQALQQWPQPAPTAPAVPTFDSVLPPALRPGNLQRRWCLACAARWRRLWSVPAAWGAVALAGVLAVAVLPRFLEPAAAPAVMRGSTVRQLAVPDPLRARDALADALAAGGADVQRYQRLGRYGVDAQLPAGHAPALRQRLAAQGLTPGDDGSVRVEFAAAVAASAASP